MTANPVELIPLRASHAEVLASLTNVTKAFGSQVALDSVTLEVFAGSAVGLLGPNGAGKSTLISLLTGLRRADDGVVRLFGQNPLTPAARSALGVTPQATAVPPTLKVREAVDLVVAHYADPVPTDELLERFGIPEIAGKQCGALSGGQQRRLLVAIALVGRPKLLVLDGAHHRSRCGSPRSVVATITPVPAQWRNAADHQPLPGRNRGARRPHCGH